MLASAACCRSGASGCSQRQRKATGTTGRHDFEAEFEPYYPDARAAAAVVDAPGRTPGAIHVEGNPLIQYLSGRPFALREHGWAPEQSDARLWKWTRDELREKRMRVVDLPRRLEISGLVKRSGKGVNTVNPAQNNGAASALDNASGISYKLVSGHTLKSEKEPWSRSWAAKIRGAISQR